MSSTIKHVKTHCPGCSKEFLTGVDVTDIVLGKLVDDHEQKKPAPEVKEVKTYPTWFPRKACTSPGCKEEHDNDNYSQKVKKKCNGLDGDCGQFLPASVVRCPWCNSKDSDGDELQERDRFDDIEEDILEKMPQPGGHNHVH